ncbi:MAG: hypothetical protein MZV65_53695 [Chromatiales bacterium]|nr:hypothetical protein [Chromatiales bacterium]
MPRSSPAIALGACQGRRRSPRMPQRRPPRPTTPSSRLATAVATGKTAAAGVVLKYDVPAPARSRARTHPDRAAVPARGAAADVLEVEVTGIPGLTVGGGNSARFEDVSSATATC